MLAAIPTTNKLTESFHCYKSSAVTKISFAVIGTISVAGVLLFGANTVCFHAVEKKKTQSNNHCIISHCNSQQ
jgi:hypothetical protein